MVRSLLTNVAGRGEVQEDHRLELARKSPVNAVLQRRLSMVSA